MKPYYQRDSITIYLGDSREIIPQLPVVDLVVTDPAYRCISGGNTTADNRCSGILKINDGKIFEYNDIDTSQYANLLFDRLRNPSHCYVFINNLNLEDALRDFRIAGFGFHNLLHWHKSNLTPNRWYMKDSEPILFFRKGEAFPINNPSAKSTFNYPSVPGNKKRHPTQKPELLLRELIQNSSNPGEVVLDPFMGSGATLEAAYCSGRWGIGIDIDEKYCESAVRYFDHILDNKIHQTSFMYGSMGI